jgi:hypothetical protein
MTDIDIYLDEERKDPQGIPLIILKINGRHAIFAKQIASVFQGEGASSSDLLKRLRDGNLYEEGEGWKNLTYAELKKFQTWEKTMSGKSAISSLFPTINPNGASIIFEEATLWLLSRSNTQQGKEFSKMLVKTFIAVRDGDYIEADTQDVKRLEEKADYSRATVKLIDTVYERGLKLIGTFNWKGDEAFYDGKNPTEVRKMKGIPEGRAIADFDSSLELKAKTFAKDLTDEAIKHKRLHTVGEMTEEYVEKNEQMRKALTDVGIYPEKTLKVEDIKEVKKRTKKQLGSTQGIKKLT